MAKSFYLKSTLVLILLVGIYAWIAPGVFAQSVPAPCTDSVCRAKLEADLAAIEKEINVQAALVANAQQQGASLQRDVTILTAQIAKSKLTISAAALQIAKLTESIGIKKQTITTYSAKIDSEHQSLAGFLRRIDELDSYSTAAFALSDKNISEFFSDLDSFQYIGDAIGTSLNVVGVAKKTTEEEKAALEDKKNKQADLQYQAQLEKKFLDARTVEKNQLIKVTKGQEAAYKRVLQDKQAKAAAIRAALFALRDSGEIQFGQALEYANQVSKQTGVRPAFLLAIFMQESGFGKNQGSCYLRDSATGAGVSSKTGNVISRVMKPDRDVAPFIDITSRVSRDPFNTLVSCPQEIGYGGAMGAAQFIPSTWVLYENRIERALGIPAADPWRARDSFMAAGLLLKDNGAKSGSYSAERNAACKYFSGSSCAKSSWASTYGTQVMSKAENIQTTMIDPIEGA
jgi:membrane-bound lytic murein transglycosylase B